mgnify:CR=1 FL=1
MYIILLTILILISGCISSESNIKSTENKSIVSDPKPQLKAELINCSYSTVEDPKWNHFWFFFKIKNIGDTPTRLPAQVCLISDPKEYDTMTCDTLHRIYEKGEILWQEKKWLSGKIGNEWPLFIRSRKDLHYRLVYCENCDVPSEVLWEEGLIIYDDYTNLC